MKPWDNAKLLATLQSAYSLRQSRKEVKKLREKQSVLNRDIQKEEDICWGKSPAMQRLLTMIKKVAVTDANVLITGENGTGKELIAKMIHRYSPGLRKHSSVWIWALLPKPFLRVNSSGM